MKIVKTGLFGSKNVSVSYVHKSRKTPCKTDYSLLINEFTQDFLVRKLLYKYLTSFSYNISIKVLKDQLDVLKPLSLDLKIQILTKTLEKGWKSLIPAYEVFTKNKFDNIHTDFVSKEEIKDNLDIVNESF